MIRGNYTYIALFKKEDGVYNVTVPDLEGVITFGESIPEAIEMAKDALEVWLLNAEDYGFEINKPRSFNELQHLADGEKDFLQYVTVDTVFARKKEDNKAVKKTLTIPNWLNELATNNEVNFSQVLQQALKKELNII